MKKSKISVIVPCYNEEQNIAPFYDACKKAFATINNEVELIFVNDGSSDNTIGELKKLLKLKSKMDIKIVNFSRNFGKEAAMYAGLQNASNEPENYAVIIDADLQQPPELVLKMIDILDNNKEIDCVCYYQEKRIENKIVSFFKDKFYRIMGRLSEIDFVNGASDFRMFRRNCVDAILSMKENNRFSKGIFSWIGFNTEYIPYIPEERLYGESSFNIKKLFKYALSGIISFSIAPIRFVTYTGLLFSVISIIYMIVVFIQKIFWSIDVPGYATLIICMLLFGGLILFALGIIGEYIARIYMEVKDRPIYITKEILGNKGEADNETKNKKAI